MVGRGVSGGIGRALPAAGLGRGDRVVGTVRRREQSEEFEQLAPGRAFAVVLDVTVPEAVMASAVDGAVETLARLDVLVNNAGYGLVRWRRCRTTREGTSSRPTSSGHKR